jgi:1-acyl-sn-glycerol-3-phosphate acyltransferase
MEWSKMMSSGKSRIKDLGFIDESTEVVSGDTHMPPARLSIGGFRPPKNRKSVIRLGRLLLPLFLRLFARVVEIDVSEEEIEGLKKLKGKRVVLTPSHSGGFEPSILFHLSGLLDMDFNYLAAREIFGRVPLLGWLMQSLGAYSIIRGTPDKNSFEMTRRLISGGTRWLVVFPEGDTCWMNDTLMPFQQGVAQFAFWACEDLARHGDLPPVYFAPIAVKYLYLKDMSGEIEWSLSRLEERLALEAGGASPYERLRRAGEAVLATVEKEYNVRPPENASLNDRIQNMKEHIVGSLAAELGITLHAEQPLIERVRDLFNAVDRIIYGDTVGPGYATHLHYHRQQEARGAYHSLKRVLHFIALYDGYVRESMTAERILDVIGLLELEVFGKRRVRGPRKAVVKIGAPQDVSGYFPSYKADKRAALRAVTADLETSVRKMLSDLSRLARVIA